MHSVPNLAQNQAGNLFFALLELDAIENHHRFIHRHAGVIGNAVASDANSERVRTQAATLAIAADSWRNHLLNCHSHLLGRRIIKTLAQPMQRAFPWTLVRISTLAEKKLPGQSVQE